jgi:hypothetical protein
MKRKIIQSIAAEQLSERRAGTKPQQTHSFGLTRLLDLGW